MTKEYYQQHKERLKKNVDKYRTENRDIINEKQRLKKHKLKEEDPDSYELMLEKNRKYKQTDDYREKQRIYHKNRYDKDKEYQKQYRLDHPKTKKDKVEKEPKVKKEKVIKPIKSLFSKTKIKQVEFLYELILSQGMGHRTKKLDNMIIDISIGFVKKFYTEYYLWSDMINAGIYDMLKAVNTFDRYKCENPLSYFSEVCKRAQSREVSIQKSTSNYGHMDTHKRMFSYVSINGCNF